MPRGVYQHLGRRDPEGYYVIAAKAGAVNLLPPGVEYSVAGDRVIIRVKSRSQAVRILKLLHEKGLLA
ncbi:hypothetical protein IG193_00650 [Infirmifilum lucidum]|uniref:Uncharacterized protein n=1 Tax=Infirmifilum lucidum TaxID=2776706 RepID=A0A7L9FGS4_9CREN|nr:hypothetical protein [Infirmifilum lucidum]QOJ79010.1 hypothetical protein IG193_00650 [Infirmifilum lucidum]